MSTFPFLQRSNLEALLKSLAMAEAPMAKKLTRLLIRSYVPADAPVSFSLVEVGLFILQMS